MKILGSGKIDDFQKIVLSDKVVRALNVKPGDSVLFYKGGGDRVEMFRAEGAHISEEFDSCPKLHLRGLRGLLYTCASVSAIFLIFTIVLLWADQSHSISSSLLPEAAYAALGISLAFAIGAIITTSRLDIREDPQRLVSVGGPYSKDRLLGLSKLVSDGKVITGNLYVNSLFGVNPDTVEVMIQSGGSEPVVALTKCIKAVPGYSTHKIRVQSDGVDNGLMKLTLHFRYSEKSIVVTALYRITVRKPDSMVIHVSEESIKAEMAFDARFQRSAFDESLFDPTDDEVTI